MSVTVAMPKLGETVTEGTVLSWAKQPGEWIAEDEVLLEISTDKVDTEVPSPVAGVIEEILVAEGETVSVGAPLVIIGEGGESQEAAEVSVEQEAVTHEPEPRVTETEPHTPTPDQPSATTQVGSETPSVSQALVPAVGIMDGPRRSVLSPVVRRLAAEHGVDLAQVPGSGDGGRITRQDVMAHIEGGAGKVSPESVAAPAPQVVPESVAAPAPQVVPESVAAPAPQVVPESVAAPAPQTPQQAEVAAKEVVAPSSQPSEVADITGQESSTAPPASSDAAPELAGLDRVEKLTRLRRVIAENMINSKRTAAHVWASVEVDYEAVERVRQKNKAAFKEREGFSLTYLPFVARATIDSLRAFPVVNTSFRLDEGTQTFHSNVNLGIAVDLDQSGLVVVTVPDADGLRLTSLAKGIRERALRARTGSLGPDDISGSTFTITNPGPFGSFMTAPIINVPNVAILSTDTVTKRPVVVTDEYGNDSIAIRHIGYIGLSWDHRAFDGSVALKFLNLIKESIQTWDWEQELS